jgi:PST family polysaccharide transporter
MAALEDKKALISNFFSLSVLQALNMFLPLFTLPYLVRVLGAENFGLVNFSLSIIMYFNILVSFGFELSATREISMNRDNIEKVSKIFSTVMLIKILLFIFSFIILSILIFSIDTLHEHMALYYVTFGFVLGNLLFPTWFFQGMEKMKYITYINFVSRVLFTILIFILVKESDDYIYVPLLNTFGTVFGGVYSLWLVFSLYKINVVLPSREEFFSHLKDSYAFFLSRVANDGSRYYAITIIGMSFGNTIVGYYSMIEKLYYAFMSLGGIVAQTIYPYMSRTKNITFFKKAFSVVVLGTILLLIPVIFFYKEILLLVFNINNEIMGYIFLIMFSGTVFGVINALIGYPLLAAYGYIKEANISLIYASIIYVIFITFAAYITENIYIVAFSLVVYTLASVSFRVYYIKKKAII